MVRATSKQGVASALKQSTFSLIITCAVPCLPVDSRVELNGIKGANLGQSSSDHLLEYIRPLARVLKAARLITSAFGVVAIAVGQAWMTSQTVWQQDWASSVFWCGVGAIIVTGLILLFFEKDSASLVLDLYAKETLVDEQLDHILYLERREEILLSWQSVTKLLAELLDQALTTSDLGHEKKKVFFNAVVEILADYKFTLFRIADEYCNISIYELSSETNHLECIACYRSRPSDALGAHRTWKVGEGHVGKAFELQRELICGNSSAPDIKPWISASPSNFDERDDDRYVSLAAVPIGVNAEEPVGVLIVTSNVPMRFANSDENHGDENVREERRLAVAALQDFAAQVGQLVAVFRLREAMHAEGTPGDE